MIFFYSCDTSMNNFHGAQITYMNSWGVDRCRYECSYKKGFGFETLFFVDSCGKYQIGDTIYLVKKCH